jgi:hypothetical protein
MALSTNTILETMEWAKRFNFNRQSGLGNSLEPALSSANIVKQVILGPPFSWWWNNQELVFTCNPTAVVSATAVGGSLSMASGVLSLNLKAAANFALGSPVLLSGFTTLTQLNGTIGIVISMSLLSPFAMTIAIPGLGDFASTADAGTITATTTQDYTVAAPNFSHIEHASLLDISKTPSMWMELKVKNNLALDSNLARPLNINPHSQDASGNMTFRVMPAPNKAYPVEVHLQKAAALITSLNSTWAPLPDFMEYIYNWGFLYFMWLFADDARAPLAGQHFVTALLSRSEGLDEQERDIFLSNWPGLVAHKMMEQQQGIQSRGISG